MWATFSGAGATWALELGNGWCSYATLASVPDAATLSLGFSFSSASPTAADLEPAFTLTTPGASDCATQLPQPLVPPAGGRSLGPVLVALSAAGPNETVAVELSGAVSAASAPYTGPFVLAQVRGAECPLPAAASS